MDIGLFVIDFSFLEQTTFFVVWDLFTLVGWIIFLWGMIYGLLYLIASYKRKIWKQKNWNNIILAVDIPAENVQTPMAVEQMFAHIFSVMDPPSIGMKYWHGFQQYQFSFEIISIEGYIQFLIRTVDKFRDVVEAAIYAQYPDAEITEVEDYTKNVPTKYPNDTHNVWASDFALNEHYAFPLRLYKEFEHNISKDTVLKDPMGTFLESFSRIGSGEQMWFQIIIEPVQEKKWKKDCIAKIKELIGEKDSSGGSGFGVLTDNFITKELGKSWEEVSAQLSGSIRAEGSDAGKSKDDGPMNNILYLTPGQKKLVEAMEDKISKIGFKTKIRAIYVARKEVYNPSRGVNSLVGAINQFNSPTSNMLLPKYLTSTEYLFAKYRKEYRRTNLMRAYKKRNPWIGRPRYVLNIEELATLWHFPMSHVKTPLVQKAALKTAEPPSGLPIETWESSADLPPDENDIKDETEEEVDESELRKTDSGDVIKNDEYNLG
jgi:hypothetical protein